MVSKAVGKNASCLIQSRRDTANRRSKLSVIWTKQINLTSAPVRHKLSSLLSLGILFVLLSSLPVNTLQAKSKIKAGHSNDEPIQLSIAVAANFKPTLEKLLSAYRSNADRSVDNQTSQYPALKFIVSSGSTGQLFAQINHGAPYDLFFSADDIAPQKLVDAGKALTDTKNTYVKGQLAYWQPKSNAIVNQLSLQNALGNRQLITLANPKFAPYGIAAQSVIDSFDKNNNKPYKLITANNIAHSFQLINSKQVHGGFVALSYLVAQDISPHQYWLIPASFYPEILQSVVILSHSTQAEAARALLKFLNTNKAKTIMLADGYLLEKE